MSSSKSHSRRPWWSTLGIYAGLSLAAFIMVVPLLFSFVTAFKSPQDFASHSPFALPSPPSLASFQAILTGRVNFGDAIITTLLMVVVMVVGSWCPPCWPPTRSPASSSRGARSSSGSSSAP